MLRFAEDTVYSNTQKLITFGPYDNIYKLGDIGFKLKNNGVNGCLVIVPANTPFKYLGDHDGHISLEVFGQELLFDDDIKAIVSSY